MKTPKYYYHFTGETLRNGGSIPAVGEWLKFTGKLEPCQSGLHASEHPFDALQYAPGKWLHKVELGSQIVTHGYPVDKVVSNRRKIIKTIDATSVMRAFARRCALDAIPLWKGAPELVVRYLKTGDESIRAAAWWDAAWAAARDAARDAAWAAARDAARDAKLNTYRQWFFEMVEEEFSK